MHPEIPRKSPLAAIAVALLLTVAVAFPGFSATPPAPATGKDVPYRSSMLVGVSFYNGQAERAGSQRGRASTQGHASFASAEEAVSAFIAALETMDVAALDAMLGPGNRDQLTLGNEEADAFFRSQFLQAYREKHALVTQGDGSKVLEVGEKEWPLPVPIVAVGGKWYLDGAASADEIAYRYIGHNELGAIAVCRGFIDAQKAYAAAGHDGHDAGVFASKLLSDPGQHNGLHWGTAKGEPPSPAAAPVTGVPYVPGLAKKLLYDLAPQPTDPQKPFHGYYYRMLFEQGANAKGGAAEYMVDGKLTRGIALLAWPAVYGTSGIMSFIVNQDGVVYQKDLGAETAAVAGRILAFDPDSSWAIVAASANTH
jgi:hypothetical protein